MNVYLVGGAVRDELLGRPVTERDWVVVGSTPEEMLALGFQPVGKDFPVFLHPLTKEEYALARTERKVAPGYKGFIFNTEVSVSLEADLLRRDLTINALAKTSEGKLIDPYGGVQAIKERCLHHVSAAFSEDPVRLLRVARFAAQLPEFYVAKDTMVFLKKMVEDGEVQHLVAERVWKECEKALKAPAPSRFFEVLQESGALPIIFPEWSVWDLIDKGQNPVNRFALLSYRLGENETRVLVKRLRCPNVYVEMALLLHRYHERYMEAKNPEACLALLMSVDALRRPQRLEQFIDCCVVIYVDPAPGQYLKRALAGIRSVDVAAVLAAIKTPADLPAALYSARLDAIRSDHSDMI